MRLDFNEETHTYTLYDDNGHGTKLTSVTTMMAHQGLSTDFNSLPAEVQAKAKAKAEIGTYKHKLIEDYVKDGKYEFEKCLDQFIDYVTKNNIKILASEYRVWNYYFAGTSDLLVQYPDGRIVMCDFKFTYECKKEYVSWQDSFYHFIGTDGHCDVELPKEYEIELWWFNHDDELEVYNVPTKDESIIKCYLYAEMNQDVYKQEVAISDVAIACYVESFKLLQAHKNSIKQLESEIAEFEEALLEAMRDNSIKTWESPNGEIRVTYTAPSSRKTFDSKALFKDHPELNDEKYYKTSSVKDKLTITYRGEE